MVLLSGVLYTLGRALAYAVLGGLIVVGVLSIPGAAQFLQKSLNQILGPILIITGAFLLGVLRLPFSGLNIGSRYPQLVDRFGLAGAALLGMLFALSSCPLSAGLFFGSLIPPSVAQQSTVLLPLFYGVGTGLPVMVFAVLVGFSAHWAGKVFNKLAIFDRWARRITGVVFIVVGIYYCLVHILGLL